MNIIQGIILGIVQGLTEFLPVSSSGHLLLLRSLFGINDVSGSYIMFDILLHVGTLIVVLVVFWKEWLTILKNPFKSKLLLFLFIASLPAFFAVIGLGDLVDYFESGRFLGLSFLITGILLVIAEKLSKKSNNAEVGIKSSIIMGISQILGLFPGVSRSGSTIFGGLLSKLDKQKAAKFSFMMSAPAILGSLIYELKKAHEANIFKTIELVPTLAGMLFAAIFGFLSIKFMLKLIQKVSLNYFALYVVVLGLLVIILQINGAIALPPLPHFN